LLLEVLAVSFVPQMFALIPPLFFQVFMDKVLGSRRQHTGVHQVAGAGERGGAARAAEQRAPGAGPDLQPYADRDRGAEYLALLWPIVRLLSRLEHRSVGG
jgi:hypothetical protein